MTAHDFLNCIKMLKDPYVRAAKIANFLSNARPSRAALWLQAVCQEATGDGPTREAAQLVLSDWARVREVLAPRAVSATLFKAQHLGLDGVVELLENRREDGVETKGTYHHSHYLRGLTLGERRALARSISPRTIDRLLNDPDPGVIRRLLWNPRVTEIEVLKIASRFPVSPFILKEVALCPRWTNRYRVKFALALNPACPLPISLGLVKLLLRQDLPTVFHKEDLNPRLREEARRLWLGGKLMTEPKPIASGELRESSKEDLSSRT